MYKTILIAGFAMFSMFFGSGNLVFPLILGTESLANYPYAMMGFILTAVFVPCLGLLSMITYKGNREKFFNSLGKKTGFTLTLLMLSLMGPFGIVPRCITVAFGGIQLVFPEASFSFFSVLFCTTIGLLILKPNKVVDIIGLFLTPFKLGGLTLLIVFGLYVASPVTAIGSPIKESFLNGLNYGYQTMDLLAGFFFSATIIEFLRQKQGKKDFDEKLLFKSSLAAAAVCAILLVVVYFGFFALGAKYAGNLTTTRPEALLAAIAGVSFGKYALILVSVTLAVSCLATAVITSNLFVNFLRVDVMHHLFKVKLKHQYSILITTITAFAISLLGFAKICQAIGVVLAAAYPALIAVAVHHIISYKYHFNYSKQLFWGVLVVFSIWTWIG